MSIEVIWVLLNGFALGCSFCATIYVIHGIFKGGGKE